MAPQTPTSTFKFTRILFESDALEALQALEESLTTGHFEQAVEWLTAWQDLVDLSCSPLNPLLDSLQEDDPATVATALRVLNRLLSSAPDTSRQFRIKNELKELNFEQLLGQISVRWAKDVEIKKEIDIWFSGVREEEKSGDNLEMEAGADVEPVLSNLRCLLADDAAKEQRIRVVLGMLDTLRNVNNLQDAEQTLQKLGGSQKKENKAPAPPPPSSPAAVPPPPPPPPRLGPPGPAAMAMAPPPPPPAFGKGPPPPPPPMGLSFPKPVPAELPPCMKPKKVPDKDVKMKPLMWAKLPPCVLTNEGKESVWGQLASEPRGFSLDLEVIEGMFSLNTTPSSTGDLNSTAVNFKKKDTLVDLLTPKRSQNVTIALKRFKNLEDVLTNLRDNKFDSFELEVLRVLNGILPDEEEVDALRRYSGDLGLLAPACSFFLQILSIPDYRLRIDCMCYRLEFRSSMDEILPQLEAVNVATLEILSSNALKRLLLLLVNIGNFLNGATAHGNAAGFKLNSLWKMIDLKAAKGGASLLHALAKMDEGLLKELQAELPTVKKASEVSLEETKGNIRQLKEQANKLEKLVEQKNETNFLEMAVYLKEESGKELAEAQDLLTLLSQRQEQLAAYFCENKNSFKVEDCFKIFSLFITRLQVAVQENEERAQREAKKMSRQSGSDENVQTGQERETPAETGLFATLGKGIPSKVSRRRSSVRTAVEYSRERDTEVESRMKRVKEEGERSPDEKGDSPGNTPRVIRRPRRSAQVEGASTLMDFMERLQATSFPPTPPIIPSNIPEENISVTIPNGCISTPGTSPKGSDEGFESEKDKEVEATVVVADTAKEEPLRSVSARELKTPRLVSITTSGSPPTPVKSAGSSLPRPSQMSRLRTTLSRNPAPQPIKTFKEVPESPPPSKIIPPRRSSAVSGLPSLTIRQGEGKAPLKSSRKPATAIKPTKTSTSPTAARPALPKRIAPAVIPTPAKAKPIAAPRKLLPSRPGPPLTRALTTDVTTTAPGVSTSARPSLIKTGFLSHRPSLKALEIVEKPRPLKKTTTTMTAKPKWV